MWARNRSNIAKHIIEITKLISEKLKAENPN